MPLPVFICPKHVCRVCSQAVALDKNFEPQQTSLMSLIDGDAGSV